MTASPSTSLRRFAATIAFALLAAAGAEAAPVRDGQHDFDFEIGRWQIQMKRLVHPLSGSNVWISPRGYVHLVRKVWNGRASLAELEINDPAPRFLGLMLRLYNPTSREWSIYWADSADGALSPPLIGRFNSGRGEFFNHDTFQGKAVLVRVVYSEITARSFHTEQSFSADGGKTWQTNLIQTFTRE